jgi:GT2 family glycosyltransferase
MTAESASRRWSGEWGAPIEGGPVDVDVLIPTVGRVAELAVTLAGIAAQDAPRLRIIIGDQSADDQVVSHPAVRAMLQVLEVEGREVAVTHRGERRGLAEQRQFLLDQATAPYVLFLDDDVWLEPGALERMHSAIVQLRCGFVGEAVQGLSYLRDDRPSERETFELWDGPVHPERVRPGTAEFERWPLHNAANLVHVASALGLEPGEWRAYRVAWVGGCTMYDRAALIDAGGFDFWSRLPSTHAGEDVAAQWRVMERTGGAGIVPSGAVHLEASTTIPDRRVNATEVVFDDTTSR